MIEEKVLAERLPHIGIAMSTRVPIIIRSPHRLKLVTLFFYISIA